MAVILVVDDEILVRSLVEQIATRMGHTVLQASSMAEGLRMGTDASGVDVVLLDVLLPDGNSLPRVREFTALPGSPELLVITGHTSGDSAETALRSGAWEYLSKPLRVPELTQALRNVIAYREARARHDGSDNFDREGIIGQSRPLLEALKQTQEAAHSDVNVLILGETGVGKELFAKAVYRNSARADMPFVTIDCACLPETLVESHLFGHTKGAFTGADRAREGLLQAAHKGTLFLDEIGDLPLPMQGAFLRALELKRFRPIGQVQEVPSDFRLVAATNRNLEVSTRSNRFRADLLYRLQGLTIYIPPLRERADDIALLAQHAIERYCRQYRLPDKELTPDCLQALLAYPWPGNVRELLHAMEHACLASKDSDALYLRHLPTDLRVAVTRGRVGQGRMADTPPSGAGTGAVLGAGANTGGAAAQERVSEQGAERGSGLDPHATPLTGAGAGISPACAPPPERSLSHDPPVHTQEAPHSAPLPSLKAWKLDAESTYLRQLMHQCRGDVRKAAAQADVSRGHLYELLKKHGFKDVVR